MFNLLFVEWKIWKMVQIQDIQKIINREIAMFIISIEINGLPHRFYTKLKFKTKTHELHLVEKFFLGYVLYHFTVDIEDRSISADKRILPLPV